MMQSTDDDNPFYTGEEKLLPTSPTNSRPASTRSPSGNYGSNTYGSETAPELQFQSFAHTSVSIPESPIQQIGGAGVGPSDFSTEPESPQPKQPPSGAHFWSLTYYQHLFDVDTNQVVERVVRSMLPFKFSFVQYTSTNPDFYGPFWIATTLIFMLAITGNLASYFTSDLPSGEWYYNFDKVTWGALTIYGYTIVIPFAMWVVFKWMKIPFRLLELLCIYGYALFVFIPASILCVVPLPVVQWIVTGIATLLSGWFLVTNLIPPLRAHEAKVGLIALFVVAGLHVGLALAFKLYFFHSG